MSSVKDRTLADAGDINTGTALSNMYAAETDIIAYGLMGYDAVTFGNHEFDGGSEKLFRQIQMADFPFVSSNIKKTDGNFLGDNQYIIKNYPGFRVGILGITTLRTLQISSPDSSLAFLPEIEAAEKAAALIRNKEKAGIVIALAHLGDHKESEDHITSRELAAAVPGIDIIIDGHSHSYYSEPVKIGGTWIVSANEWGKYIGMGRLSVINGVIENFSWEAVEIGAIAPQPEMAELLSPYIEGAAASLSEKIGTAAEDFDFGNRLTRYQETAIGNLICDSNVWYYNNVYHFSIDFAFHNGGSIRANLYKGDLTREDILTVLPFENYLYIVSLAGSEIIELFNFAATVPQGSGGFPQFSSEVSYTLNVLNSTISDLIIGGAPVDPGRTYR